MPHVSSKKLDPFLMDTMFSKLLKTFERAQHKNSLSSLMSELFTPTEKIMFAKRLAIVLMLTTGIPQEKITSTLKVSPTTVVKISFAVEVGAYNTVLKISKDEKVGLEKVIWNILTVGGIMPPRAG